MTMHRTVIALAAALLLAACATEDEIVLLADDDGSVGQIAVNPGGEEVVIADAFQRARVAKGGQATVDRTDAAAVDRDYRAAIGAMPRAPKQFTLRYEFGSDVLDADSLALIPRIAAAIEEHAPADVVIVGHTDTVGEDDYNDALSLRRAEAVRDQLVAAGLEAGRIEIWGRGEREPLEPGEDRRSELNRRAEVIVR
jgi:outer membrane protein OmpA-like peptidoglycan-associated protein